MPNIRRMISLHATLIAPGGHKFKAIICHWASTDDHWLVPCNHKWTILLYQESPKQKFVSWQFAISIFPVFPKNCLKIRSPPATLTVALNFRMLRAHLNGTLNLSSRRARWAYRTGAVQEVTRSWNIWWWHARYTTTPPPAEFDCHRFKGRWCRVGFSP